jgi:predicted glycosyltransferase
VVSGSPALHQLRLPNGLDYIKLPCLSRDEDGVLGVRFLKTEPEETIQLRSELIRTAAAHFQPDVVLVDKKPDGLKSELQITLDWLQRHRPQTRLVLLLRDILDSPAATIAQWQQSGYYALAENRYNQVWIVGTPDIFDAPREYQFSSGLWAKTRFMGYVRRGQGLRTPEQVRQSLGLTANQPLVLVTPGGGGDGYRLVDSYLQSLAAMPADLGLTSLIIGGPEMPAEQRQSLIDRVQNNPALHWLDFTDDLASFMVAADVVVSMGGYNTVGEILSLRKRAVVVPRTQPVEEQWIRAQRMAELGLFAAIHPDQLTPSGLAQAILQELSHAARVDQPSPKPASSPSSWQSCGYVLDLNALPRITEALLSLMTLSCSVRLPEPVAV